MKSKTLLSKYKHFTDKTFISLKTPLVNEEMVRILLILTFAKLVWNHSKFTQPDDGIATNVVI